MNSLPKITLNHIRKLATQQSYERGENDDGISAQSILITFLEELINHYECVDDSSGFSWRLHGISGRAINGSYSKLGI